ncbi:MAG: 4-alpha-glucanotransferase [Deltaproteobacteria bacterium]|nr:4-alpha-glucanotransferase [Deltaproteobacteria bacterium]
MRKDAGLFDGEKAAAETMEERRNEKGKLLTMLSALGLLGKDGLKDLAAFQEVTGSLHNAVVGFLAITPCKLFVLSQEDLFKDKRQQNMPGTTHHYPNWSIKMKYSVEELFSNRQVRAYSMMFRSWVERSGRGKPHTKRRKSS